MSLVEPGLKPAGAGTFVSNPRPVELELVRGERLDVLWEDGHRSTYPLALLRRACPCATCRSEREQQQASPLRILKSPGDPERMITVESAELVGNYAVRFVWRDGHDTGIYDFRALRDLCPCEACRPGGAGAGSSRGGSVGF